MRTFDKIGLNDVVNLATELYSSSDSIYVSLIGWEDGDYFVELCEENGGVIGEHLTQFISKPLGMKLKSLDELKQRLTIFNGFPFLHSVNGDYKYHWDLHAWIGNNLMIYNAELEKLELHRLNFIGKSLGLDKQPMWISQFQVR